MPTPKIEGPVELLVSGYDSPEGPAFHKHGSLYFVNWLSSSIVRRTPDGEHKEFVNTGGIPAGLAFHPDATLYVADEGDQWHGVLRLTPTGETSPCITEYRGKPLNGANDLVFDSKGVLYFSDPWRSSVENPIGGFYRVFPDGRLEQLDTGLAFPNGVAVAADDRTVYLAETGHNHILRYAISEDGTVGERTVFARLRDGNGPDGMAFDEAGNLYVAHWSAARVDVFSPAGEQILELPVPGQNPTNVAFGGEDRRTLVITEVATGSLYSVRMSIPGQKLFG